jgi:type II secretory pathway pseudopilin PulG
MTRAFSMLPRLATRFGVGSNGSATLPGRLRRRAWDERGFTLLELFMVCTIVAIGAGMVVMIVPRAIQQSQADSSARLVAGLLRDAREAAIAKRRNMQVTFIAPNQIRISRVEYDWEETPPEPALTVEKTVPLEGPMTYTRLPEDGPIPDFAPGEAAVTYEEVEGERSVTFTPEGAAVGADGEPVDGTIFLGRAGQLSLSRAVTMSGVTASVERWAFDGTTWRAVK